MKEGKQQNEEEEVENKEPHNEGHTETSWRETKLEGKTKEKVGGFRNRLR